VPGLSAFADFHLALARFPVDDLGLTAQAAALALARSSVEGTGMLLLGEVHGVAENPLVIRELVALLDLRWVALEWPRELDDTVRAFVDTGMLHDHPFLGWGDGRITVGHLAVLRALRTERPGLQWWCCDTAYWPTPRPGESQWTARDRAMADTVLERLPVGGGLVVAGNAHTPLVSTSNGITMGAWLARARPGLRAVTISYGRGRYYNLGSRRFLHPRRPRPIGLNLHDDALLLNLPAPTEATVLHRPAARSGSSGDGIV